MSQHITAIREALALLDEHGFESYPQRHALKAALEQPAQDEPVARLHISETDTYPDIEVEVLNGATLQPSMSPVNVYTRPQAREPLTDEQIEDEWERLTGHSIFGGDRAEGRAMYLSPDEVTEFARAIEAAHGIGEKK